MHKFIQKTFQIFLFESIYESFKFNSKELFKRIKLACQIPRFFRVKGRNRTMRKELKI
jgi:hypothetical protein